MYTQCITTIFSIHNYIDCVLCGTIDIIIYLLFIETHCLTTPPVVHQTYCLVFVVEKQNMKYLPTKLN